MKKFLVLALAILIATGSIFASGASEGTPESVTLKISIAEPSTDLKADVLREFTAEVEEATSGAIKFETYYSNELGSLADVIEQIQMGANIITGTSGDFFASYGAPDIMATALQYVVPTQDAVEKLNDSELFEQWSQQIEEASGIKVLCMNWGVAPRSVISTKPINSVGDFKGLKIRVPGLAADSFFSALGASTMTMTMTDVYTGMQQGMVDAVEASLSTLYSYSFQEVAKYVYLSEHSLAPMVWAMSASVWNKISPENQQILLDALDKYGYEFTKLGFDTQPEYINLLEEAGCTIVTPTEEDKAFMQEKGLGTFEDFPEMTPGLADEISKIIG